MKYIISENIALRSWWHLPYAYYIKNQRNALGLKKEEYQLLLQCDGEQEIEDSPLLQNLCKRGLCRSAKEKETLSEWQKEKICDNRYFPAMSFMISGKCNFNCLHCFNAADNSRLQSEFTLEEAKKLIREAQECGINAFTITGGEPMLHPNFMEIVREIYARDMYVREINTNGVFITKEILDELKSIGSRPTIKISFDGIGHHDWLRNKEGAEADAIRALKLCVENGFVTKAQTNVHRLNRETILPSAKLLSSIGVDCMRIIRTTEAPRWVENAGDACLTIEEYFDSMTEFLREYVKLESSMEIDIWKFASVWPQNKTFRPRPIECAEGEYRDSIPVCRGNRGMVSVAASGQLHPCHQFSGYYDKKGWTLGNVKETGLKPLLQTGDFIDNVCATLKDLKDNNEKCRDCKWFKYCCGGCRAVGLSLSGEIYGSDKANCIFFNNGYIEKLQEAMPGYQNISPIAVYQP